jgi:hypothetical protein
MITEFGKGIIGKYLIGQAPAYASYIAIGCGPTPAEANSPDVDYSSKKTLDMEMFRVPVISRGYVNDNGVNKVVLTAELPTEDRYEISEIGLYSAGSNPSASVNDSRTVFAFDDSKEWVIGSGTSIPTVSTPLDAGDDGVDDLGTDEISLTYPVFKTNADNRVFANTSRVARYERSRFLNRMLVVRGNHSSLEVVTTNSVDHLNPTAGSYISLSGESFNFTQNAPTDELKLAFSVINRVAGSSQVPATVPDEVRILVDFSSSATFGSEEWARFEIILDDYDFENNRYIVITKQLQELYKSAPGFSWNSVDNVRIYTSVLKDDAVSPDFYVAYDALRLENKNESNPLYGMTGYTVIKNTNANTIVKQANKTSYVEFRFSMDVG